MPAQSKGRGARKVLALQLGAGSGKGQDPTLVPWTIAQLLWERGGPPINRNWLAVVGGLNGLVAGEEEIAKLFQQVLLICDDLGLIGKEMFAVDGCKMPSNASKEWSGTKADLKKKARKIDGAVRYLLKKHRDEDKKGEAEESIRQREQNQIETLRAASEKIEKFLAQNEEKTGRSGNSSSTCVATRHPPLRTVLIS